MSDEALDEFSSELKQRIEKFYTQHGYQLGWRLLASPKATLQTADIALIGQTPGGDRDYPEHPNFCTRPGESAYRDEVWGDYRRGEAPLQKQVCVLFDRLGVAPHDVLSGHFVPFRSPEYDELRHKKEAEAFSRKLWQDIFDVAKPKLVIALGGVAFAGLHGILQGTEIEKISIDWGKVSARRADCNQCVLVGLPHFSRFPIMSRKNSAEGLNRAFRGFLR